MWSPTYFGISRRQLIDEGLTKAPQTAEYQINLYHEGLLPVCGIFPNISSSTFNNKRKFIALELLP
jgi:hypothetical protein